MVGETIVLAFCALVGVRIVGEAVGEGDTGWGVDVEAAYVGGDGGALGEILAVGLAVVRDADLWVILPFFVVFWALWTCSKALCIRQTVFSITGTIF